MVARGAFVMVDDRPPSFGRGADNDSNRTVLSIRKMHPEADIGQEPAEETENPGIGEVHLRRR